jgi:hypothetical protein
MAKLVRLKPLDRRRGHVIQRYSAFSTVFDASRGWYRVSDEMAEHLATVHQIPEDEGSPLAFEVCTEEEVTALDLSEKKKVEEAQARAPELNLATPHNPHDVRAGGDLTTEDLREPSRRSRSKAGAGSRA